MADQTPQPRSVAPDDLFAIQWVDNARLSPDGKLAAYTVTRIIPDDTKPQGKPAGTPPEFKPVSAIWLVDTESGQRRQLTAGTSVDTSPEWSPDGRQIAFVSSRGEKPQLHLIAIDGGEARPITTLAQGVSGSIAWSPDGRHIAFTARTRVEDRDAAKPYRVSRHIWRFNGMGLIDDALQSLYVVPAAGGEARQITKDALLNTAPQWSPDGKELLYLAMMQTDTHYAFLTYLRIVNLLDGQSRDLVPADWGGAYSAAWLPNGRQVAFVGERHTQPIGSKADLYIVDAAGGEPVNRSASFKYSAGGGLEPDMPVFSNLTRLLLTPENDAVLLDVQIGGTTHIYRFALQGPESITPVLTGDRSCLLQGAVGGKIAYIESSYTTAADLHVVNIDGSGDRKLTDVNDALFAGFKPIVTRGIKFAGSDGTEVEGFFNAPAEGIGPFPTILLIHGGPHSAFGYMFNFHVQMFCGAGYAVLQVNHRASTGYGDAFATGIHGDWGNLDYHDLMAGVDHVVGKGWADPEKLGICGLSGGGNLTCWTIGQTTRFKAAVPENPVTNWVSFYGVSDIGPWFSVRQLGGHPHEIPEVYARCSPITYAHRCKTPTLLVQAEADWRCPPEQSEQFYTVLKVNGCTVEMLRMPNEPHAGAIIGAPHTRMEHNKALLDWMNRYVLGLPAAT